MKKNPSWRIGVSIEHHHIVDIEASTAEEACEIAMKEARQNSEDYCTSRHVSVTSIFINDRKSKDYANYIPEALPKQKVG